MKIERVELSKLAADPANVRKHNAKNLKAIEASLRRFGQQKPIVVDGDGIVRAGNGTLAAAQQLGWTHIDIVRTSLKGADATAYAIADNRTAELAEWDEEALAQQLAAIQIEDEELAESSGFDTAEIEKMVLADKEVVEDEVPEPPTDPSTKQGDLWILGEHRLLCGDSTKAEDMERLMAGEVAEMIATDPPYGVSYVGRRSTMFFDGKRLGKNDHETIHNDDLRGKDLEMLFKTAIGLGSKYCVDTASFYIFFGINRAADVLSALSALDLVARSWLIWDKGNVGFHAMNAQYKPNFEAFLYCHKDRASPDWCGNTTQQTILRHSVEHLGLHPTGKPVALMVQILGNHPAKIVLDLFLGSGTTLIAAEQLGRKCYGMEISPAYCDVIVKRWETLTGKKAVLEPRTQNKPHA
jgi:DNA modification methylase